VPTARAACKAPAASSWSARTALRASRMKTKHLRALAAAVPKHSPVPGLVVVAHVRANNQES